MKYYFLFVFSLLCAISTVAQQVTTSPAGQGSERMYLVDSRNAVINAKTGRSTYYNATFKHKGNTLYSDSSYMYEDDLKRQFFEAFGNVLITQPSGSTIYADRLHYDATPQIATLTNNVRMVDANSVLTTNFLVYKMRDKIGTYTGGGRIISKGDTITSKNGYYFENTQDAYFRNKVVVRTPDVKIYTDTMRYNSMQRVTYFFGPTNIKGNKGENLYTEKGNYNTASGQANFSKNNLYTEGTRFLKGDSLYYERATGLGKAYRNVVFVDTLDKFYAYGGYGLYNQAEESITMTDKPLIITVVNNDSTKTNAPDSTAVKTDKELTKKEKRKNDKKQEEQENLTLTPGNSSDSTMIIAPAPEPPKVDSAYMTADTLYSKMILLKDYKALHFNLDRNGGALDVEEDVNYGDDEDLDSGQEEGIPLQDSLQTDSVSLNLDSLKLDGLPIDSLQKDPVVKKTQDLVSKSPVVKKPAATVAKAAATAKGISPPTDIAKSMQQDSLIRQKAVVPRAAEADSLINKALASAQQPDTVYRDTSNQAYLDTARTRIVKAYHNVRLFKSDLQAVADSVYYGMADSMFRFMGRPMIWSDGSQISSDTIYMQVQNQRMDNALLINNAFMVNAVLDSLKFNQLKGRKITAFFANNSIDRLYVDGNAENLTFATNDKTNKITDMFHDRGARIKIKMENKKLIDYITVRKVDQKVYPFRLVTQENEVLPGFIWRPQDRPTSKEDMMNRKRDRGQEGGESKNEEAVEDKAADASKEKAAATSTGLGTAPAAPKPADIGSAKPAVGKPTATPAGKTPASAK